MNILLKNGHIFTGEDFFEGDILIENGKISRLEKNIPEQPENKDIQTFDLKNKLVAPGFIDMHVHLREPGFEFKETIKTGTKAAAKGGYTTVAAMPNTNPIADNAEIVNFMVNKAKEDACVRVLPVGAITLGEKGQTLTDFDSLKACGVVGFSDDGKGIQSEEMMRSAMLKARSLNMPILAHCEIEHLHGGHPFNDGKFSREHQMLGVPCAAEVGHVERDLKIAAETNCHYHICHISCADSIRLVRDAKKKNIHVTAEVTPHHLLLTDEDIPDLDSNFKMNPPLRSPEDKKMLCEALKDGTIDIIATDHAPHTQEEKRANIHCAPYGVVGLETAFPLLYTRFVKEENYLKLEELLKLLSTKPAQIFSLTGGFLKVGMTADIVVIDLEQKQKVNPKEFLSKGQNTPFADWDLWGWPTLTLVGGQIAWQSSF
ncbi:MAG: dihydroorotase [Bacteriovoracaceae bacterium]|nr:dihydroorotase [Bacteriovoracaceae bacterium]